MVTLFLSNINHLTQRNGKLCAVIVRAGSAPSADARLCDSANKDLDGAFWFITYPILAPLFTQIQLGNCV